MREHNNVVDLFDRIALQTTGKHSARGQERGLRPFWNLAAKPESLRSAIGDCSVVSRRIDSTGSISRENLRYCQFLCPATYIYYGALHEQYLVNGEFHLGPRILQWSRGEET